MPTMIALLRGINVGGKRMKMAELRGLFSELGYMPNKTLLASGNVVFATETEPETNAITQQLEAAIIERFGVESKIVVRTVAELRAAVGAVPFAAERLEAEPKKVAVMFLTEVPSQAGIDALMEYEGVEQIVINEREVYLDYVEGMGTSKLTTNLLEKRLGVIGTVRNWSTTQKLLTLAQEFEG